MKAFRRMRAIIRAFFCLHLAVSRSRCRFSSGVAKQLHSHDVAKLTALYPVEFSGDFERYFTPILV